MKKLFFGSEIFAGPSETPMVRNPYWSAENVEPNIKVEESKVVPQQNPAQIHGDPFFLGGEYLMTEVNLKVILEGNYH